MSLIASAVSFEGKSFPVSFASDDSVDTVRQRIGAVLDRHPDRLFIQLDVQLPKDYYQEPRAWERLFWRLALPSTATSTSAQLMRLYTQGEIETGVSRDDWEGLTKLRVRSEGFRERRIFGVEEAQSLVLPVPPDATIAAEVPPARVPLPQATRIVSSIHPFPISAFHAVEIPEAGDAAIRNVYAPYLRVGTPQRLPAESVRAHNAQFETWKKLTALPAPKQTGVHITRARWLIPWVRTDLGDAVRARFEEILYGMTVSKDTPYIGLFTNREYGMQHKFWEPASRDTSVWTAWIQSTRPQRNRPTLLLYRGEDRSNFDRLAVTSTGIMATVYRTGTKTTDLDTHQHAMREWIESLDALMPFVDPLDLDTWELQEVFAEAMYPKTTEEPDLRRLPCLAPLFVEAYPVFRLLRADKTDRDLTDLDVAILQALKRDIATTAEDLAESLHISAADAARRLEDLRGRVQEDPSILTQELDVMPRLEVSGNKILLQHAVDLERIVNYANLLRYVLTGKGAELDAVCPPRVEREAPVAAVAPTVPTEPEMPALEAVDDDLAAYLDQMGSARAPVDPTFNYYTARLRTADPDTFDLTYPRKCESKRQVLLMTPEQQEKWKDTEYDVSTFPPGETLEIPSGVAVCPEYWCMRDEIPLRKSQLKDDKCPVCGGKVRAEKSTESISAAPVIARDAEYKSPRFLKDASSKNGQGMPCCYMTTKTAAKVLAPKAPDEGPAEPYYVMGANKVLPPMRAAYLPEELAKRLRVNTGFYRELRRENNRIKEGMRGIFRLGMARPSKTLGTLLKMRFPHPRDSVPKLLQCAFVRTWRSPKDDEGGKFEEALMPYIPDAEARATMARLMAGVSSAYENGTLTTLQELEYVALVGGFPVYRVDVETMTVSCGFWTQYFGEGKTAIAVVDAGASVDLLAFGTRRGDMEWKVDLSDTKAFPPSVVQTLKEATRKACATPLPSAQDATQAAMRIGLVPGAPVVVDPTGYAQAIWAPKKYVLPMRPDVVIPASETRRVGYSDMTDDDLPTYADERAALEKAAPVNPGFAWKRDVFDTEGQRVEIETASGLRVPVVAEKIDGAHVAEEVLKTIRRSREAELITGKPNAKDVAKAAEISYEAEVLDFLMFLLSKDVAKDDYRTLRLALESGSRERLAPELKKWYAVVAHEMSVTNPEMFVRKVRQPCGQFETETTCTGVCGWKDGKCKVRVDRNDQFFQRLLGAMVGNTKQRAMVLDGRASPFFSTVLYLEMPNERFLTDAQIKWEKTQAAE